MSVVYRSISLTCKDFRTYLENYDLKNLRAQIDIHENNRRGEIFAPLSDNFIIIRCKLDSGFHGFCTHLIYDFDNKTYFRIGAFTNTDDDPIKITPQQTEDFTAEFYSTELFIDTLLPDETEGEICFWGSKLGVVSTLTTVDFSVKWERYREYRQEWFKDYFPVGGLSDNFDNSLILFSNICSYDKEFLLQLSNYKINLIFKGLANLNRISKVFDSIRPAELPSNNIERAREQKNFINSHEALIFETEDSLQNIYFFLNTLKVTSKDNIFTILKKFIGPYVTGKVTDEVGEKVGETVVWIQGMLSSN